MANACVATAAAPSATTQTPIASLYGAAVTLHVPENILNALETFGWAEASRGV